MRNPAMAHAEGQAGLAGGGVLITGGAGFIGSRVARFLAPVADRLMVLDDLSIGRPDLLAPVGERVELVRRDVRDPRTVADVRSFAPDVVFHLAGIHYIPDCIRDPERTIAINTGGTANVLAGLRDVAVRSVVLASSAAVYSFSDRPLDEHAPMRSNDPYGTSKQLAERVITDFHRERPDVRCAAARLFNVFGPNDTNPHVIPRIVEQATRSSDVRIGHLWPKRDFVFVDDVARALIAASSAPNGFRAFNVGTGTGTSVRQLVAAVGRATGRRLRPVEDEGSTRAVDGHLVADPSRVRSELGWAPEVTLHEGLREIVRKEVAA
jgi:UDP-glucose 4-epimerase